MSSKTLTNEERIEKCVAVIKRKKHLLRKLQIYSANIREERNKKEPENSDFFFYLRDYDKTTFVVPPTAKDDFYGLLLEAIVLRKEKLNK